MGISRFTWMVITVLGLLVAFAPLAQAERDIKAELAATQASQRQTASQAKKLAAEVSGIKKKLVGASSRLRKVEDSLATSDRKLADLQTERRTLLERLYRDEKSLHGLLGAARRYDRTPTALILLQRPPLDAARTSHLMKGMLPSLEAQSADARKDLAALAQLEQTLNTEKKKNEKELHNYNKEQEKLDVLLKDRQKIYVQTEASRKAQEREVTRLAQEAKSIEELVAKIRQKPRVSPGNALSDDPDEDGEEIALTVAPGKALTASVLPDKKSRYSLPSHIQHPVSGTVRTGFGEKDDLGAIAKGVTFTTRANATVITPLAGNVRFAGAFQKYRRILIIEHRGGYHTLIAGLGRIDTVVGARLSAGEPIGSSENANPALIYFELRHNGKPINPQKLAYAQTRNKEKI